MSKNNPSSIAVLACVLSVLVCSRTYSGDAKRFESVEAKIHLTMLSLQTKMADLAVREAEIEVDKFRNSLRAAKERGENPYETTEIELNIKQAMTQVERRKIESEMKRLELELVKAKMERDRAAVSKRRENQLRKNEAELHAYFEREWDKQQGSGRRRRFI